MQTVIIKEEDMDVDAIYTFYIKRALLKSVLVLSAFLLLWILASSTLGVSQAIAEDKQPFDRVLSIGGSITEIVHALGEEDRLVARDTTSLYPKKALNLPDVGYIRRLSAEGVLSVRPDLILALEGSGPPETMDALEAANIPIVMVDEGYTAEAITAKIRTVGKALGVHKKAEMLVAETSEKLIAVLKAGKNISVPKKVLFVLTERGGRIMAAGAETAAASIIDLAGAENVFSHISGYKQIADEAIISAQPEVILMMEPVGGHGKSDDEILNHPAIAATPAGEKARIVRMDGLLLLGFGPRTSIAVTELRYALSELN